MNLGYYHARHGAEKGEIRRNDGKERGTLWAVCIFGPQDAVFSVMRRWRRSALSKCAAGLPPAIYLLLRGMKAKYSTLNATKD